MQTLQVILILAIFVAGVVLMMTKKLPAILALPVMGILIAAAAGVPFVSSDKETQTITNFVITQGAAKLGGTIVVTIFGAIFARVIQKEGISDAIIRKAAELAGDKAIAIALALTAATAIIFTSMSGAGPVIMVSQIAIPLMLSAGIAPVAAASLVLFGLNIGLLFNVSQYQLYVDTIGMEMSVIKSTSLVMGVVCILVTVAYIFVNVRKTEGAHWAMQAPGTKVSPIAMVMPLLPVLLVFLFKMDANVALLISILVTSLITKPSETVQVISGSVVEGIKDVAGVIALMMGIGILLNGVAAKATSALMQPVIGAILPSHKIVYVILFTVLSPLALYRGPLNMYGLGSGLANIFLQAGSLSASAVGMALRSTSVVQCVSDPTNTQNVIVADYAKVDVNDILKSTLPYTMVMALAILVYTAAVHF
ncbi:transporter [[Clostridium] aminophilum]|uniref:transporter n=1 Tax=[Clostridium] aminophilum TaxID=1526 RepID=UPI0026EA39CE|nr:transporter [[Clostridium] aminophilum]MDD6196276.1 transporter [[Clostridium] aminophilum]